MKTILKAYRGSIAHGTNTSASDVDLFSIVVMPPDYYTGLRSFESKHEGEHAIYDIKHALRMLSKSSPNLLPYLFLINKPLEITDGGRTLLNHKHLFISKQIAKTFGAFAINAAKKDTPKGRYLAVLNILVAEQIIRFNEVRQYPRELLLDIKAGIYNPDIDFITSIANSLEKYTAGFQEYPNFEQINRLCVRIINEENKV